MLQYGAQSTSTCSLIKLFIAVTSGIPVIRYTSDPVYRLCANTHDNQYRHRVNIVIQLNTGIPPSSTTEWGHYNEKHVWCVNMQPFLMLTKVAVDTYEVNFLSKPSLQYDQFATVVAICTSAFFCPLTISQMWRDRLRFMKIVCTMKMFTPCFTNLQEHHAEHKRTTASTQQFNKIYTSS